MLTISKPLSASQARTYHAREFAAQEQNYWSRDQQGHSAVSYTHLSALPLRMALLIAAPVVLFLRGKLPRMVGLRLAG